MSEKVSSANRRKSRRMIYDLWRYIHLIPPLSVHTFLKLYLNIRITIKVCMSWCATGSLNVDFWVYFKRAWFSQRLNDFPLPAEEDVILIVKWSKHHWPVKKEKKNMWFQFFHKDSLFLSWFEKKIKYFYEVPNRPVWRCIKILG